MCQLFSKEILKILELNENKNRTHQNMKGHCIAFKAYIRKEKHFESILPPHLMNLEKE